jgi:hypothetical protein
MSLWWVTKGSDAKKKVDEKVSDRKMAAEVTGKRIHVCVKKSPNQVVLGLLEIDDLDGHHCLGVRVQTESGACGWRGARVKPREIMETSVDDESDRNGARVFSCQIKQMGSCNDAVSKRTL